MSESQPLSDDLQMLAYLVDQAKLTSGTRDRITEAIRELHEARATISALTDSAKGLAVKLSNAEKWKEGANRLHEADVEIIQKLQAEIKEKNDGN